MALSPCTSAVDPSGRELVEHGSAAFPIACYHDNLSENDVPWHWHEELEAGIVTEGTALLTVGREEFVLKAGDGFFINSGVLHGAYTHDSCCRIHSLVFHCNLVGGHTDSIFFQNYLNPMISDPTLDWIHFSWGNPFHKQALACIENAWQQCANEPADYAFSVRHALSELIFLIRTNCSSGSTEHTVKSGRDLQRIKQMLSFIHNHFDSEVTIAAIASAASISESECLRCFRSTIRTTPIQYLKQYRIRQAARLLRSSNSSVTDIAYQCGFQDVSYFTRAFRLARGCTPTEYRKKTPSGS